MKNKILAFLMCIIFIILFSACYSHSNTNVSYNTDNATLTKSTKSYNSTSIDNVDYDISNLCPIRSTELTTNGITFSYNGDGAYLVNGTSERGANYNLYSDKKKLPNGFLAGETYRLNYKDTSITEKLSLCIYWFDQVGDKENELINSTYSTNFTIPENAVGLIIRLRVISANVKIDNALVNPVISAVEKDIKLPGPMLTIIDDDGCYKFYTDLLPLCKKKGVSISTAVVPMQIDEREKGTSKFWMSWAEIKECNSNGIEVLSHTYDHASTEVVETRSIVEIRDSYVLAKNILSEHGIQTNILVYSGNSGSLSKCVSAAGDTYEFAIRSGGNVDNQYGFMDPYNIWRYKIQYDYGFDSNNMKVLIDTLASNKTGWMVWMIHTSDSNWCKEYVEALSESIDYAKKLGIPIVTVEEGAKAYTWK